MCIRDRENVVHTFPVRFHCGDQQDTENVAHNYPVRTSGPVCTRTVRFQCDDQHDTLRQQPVPHVRDLHHPLQLHLHETVLRLARQLQPEQHHPVAAEEQHDQGPARQGLGPRLERRPERPGQPRVAKTRGRAQEARVTLLQGQEKAEVESVVQQLQQVRAVD